MKNETPADPGICTRISRIMRCQRFTLHSAWFTLRLLALCVILLHPRISTEENRRWHLTRMARMTSRS